jgi:GST-like protein
MKEYALIGSPGCGSAIIELALTVCKAPYRVENIPFMAAGEGRDRLLALNPTGQVPTLILPDGYPMTESAAMILLLAERFPNGKLAPSPESTERAAYLRWLIYVVASIYSTFTLGDFPERFVEAEEHRKAFRKKIVEHRVQLWDVLEKTAHGPFFLASGRSAIDLYIAVMLYWHPGKKVYDARVPKLSAIANEVAKDEALATILRAHFG